MTDTPPAGNSSYKKLAIQWLNEGQFFNQTLVWVESLCFEIATFAKPQTVIGNLKKTTISK